MIAIVPLIPIGVGLVFITEAFFFSRGLRPRFARLALGVVLAALGGALLAAGVGR